MEFLLEDDGGYQLPADKLVSTEAAGGDGKNSECDGQSVASESTTASGSTSASLSDGIVSSLNDIESGSPPPPPTPLPGLPARDFRCPVCLRDFYKKDSFCI
jgi:hypothetical protein